MLQFKLSFQFFQKALMALSFVAIFTACNNEDEDPQTITDIVISNPDFSILESAIVKASTVENLAGLLDGTDEYTVFAPNNAAFIASGLTQSVIDNTPAADLVKILKYHVLGGKVSASAVTTGAVQTALGSDIYLTKESNGGVTINGAIDLTKVTVTTADVAAANGVIHVVDKVILPKTIEDIVVDLSNLTTGAQFKLLKAAIIRAGLLGVLDGNGPFTVFAPTDAAFQATAFNTEEAINAADVNTLANIIKYHVVKANTKVYSTQVGNNAVVTMLNDGTVTTKTTGGVFVDYTGAGADAQVIIANVTASNGVIHVVDKVLIP